MTSPVWNNAVRAPVSSIQARVELAAVCRLIASEGFAPIGGARLAARDPERAGVYFVNPGGMLLDEIHASALIEVDADGNRCDSGRGEPDSGALELVLAALEARPEAAAAAQVATTAGNVVAALREGLLPITQTAFLFVGAIGSMNWDPDASRQCVRGSIAHALGTDARAVLVRGRGLLVCAETLAHTWKLLFFLNKCCQSQIEAMAVANATGRQLKTPSEGVIDHAVAQSRSFVAHPRFIADWPSYLDQLDSEDASFRE
jgi:ribulose-5-phosphate 4-epimerase/fuculose-1-phosphate aldolase